MTKIIKITYCSQCPHFSSYVGWKCIYPKRFTIKEIEDISHIPDWCPLENTPTELTRHEVRLWKIANNHTGALSLSVDKLLDFQNMILNKFKKQ